MYIAAKTCCTKSKQEMIHGWRRDKIWVQKLQKGVSTRNRWHAHLWQRANDGTTICKHRTGQEGCSSTGRASADNRSMVMARASCSRRGFEINLTTRTVICSFSLDRVLNVHQFITNSQRTAPRPAATNSGRSSILDKTVMLHGMISKY
jgi:hypothetical protein